MSNEHNEQQPELFEEYTVPDYTDTTVWMRVETPELIRLGRDAGNDEGREVLSNRVLVSYRKRKPEDGDAEVVREPPVSTVRPEKEEVIQFRKWGEPGPKVDPRIQQHTVLLDTAVSARRADQTATTTRTANAGTRPPSSSTIKQGENHMLTATENLNIAHDATFCIAKRAAAVLAAHEGLGVTMTRAEIARAIGIDTREASSLDTFITYLALDAAIAHRGWTELPSDGSTVKRFVKRPKHTHYRRPSMSPVARARARTRA